MAQRQQGSPADRQSKRKAKPRASVASLSDGTARLSDGAASLSAGTDRMATLIQSHWRRKLAERDVDMIRMIYQNTRNRRASAEEAKQEEWWLQPEEPPRNPLSVFQGWGRDVVASAKVCSCVKKSLGAMQGAAIHTGRVRRLRQRLGALLAVQQLRAESTAKAAERDLLWRSLCIDGEEDIVLDDARIQECDAAAIKIQSAWSKHALRKLSGRETARGTRKTELQGRVKRLNRLSANAKAADLSAARAEQAAKEHVQRMSSAARKKTMNGGMSPVNGGLSGPLRPQSSASPCSTKIMSVTGSPQAAASPRGSPVSRGPFQETPPRLIIPVPAPSTSSASSSAPRPDVSQDAPPGSARGGRGRLVPSPTPRGTTTLHFMPQLDPSPTVCAPEGDYGGGTGCSTPMRQPTPRPTGDPCQPGKPRRPGSLLGASGLPAATPCRSRSSRPMARTMQGTPSSTLALVGGTMVSGGPGQSTLQPPGPTPRQSTLATPPSLVSPRGPMLLSASSGRPVDPTAKGANASGLRPYAVQRTPRRA